MRCGYFAFAQYDGYALAFVDFTSCCPTRPTFLLRKNRYAPAATPISSARNDEMKENLTPKFREFIDKKYNEKFSPEQILGYIYAVLYHKTYREKFLDFLKIDYPKIPFVESKESFLKLSKLGQELINLHLMKIQPKCENVGMPEFERDVSGKNIENYTIEQKKILYKEKKIYVNESLHFKGVERAVWEYKIGGYAVLDKYLKSHKNEKIDFEHFENIIKVLHKSLEIEKQIAKIELV